MVGGPFYVIVTSGCGLRTVHKYIVFYHFLSFLRYSVDVLVINVLC